MKLRKPVPQASNAVVTVLELRGDTGLVQRLAAGQTVDFWEFPLGVDSLVRQCLRHEPALPIELEQAIELTEDAVMPLAARFAGGGTLVLKGLGALLIAQALQGSAIGQNPLALDQVEALFNRLVALSLGRPASQETLPTDVRFLAAMLVLREFMHHLSFERVELQP